MKSLKFKLERTSTQMTCIVILVFVHRYSRRRSRPTKKKSKIARNMLKPTLMQSRYGIIMLLLSFSSMEQHHAPPMLSWVAVFILLGLPSQDYELQVVTYKALQDPIASPLKKTKMESASDDIIQEVRHRGDIHLSSRTLLTSSVDASCVCFC